MPVLKKRKIAVLGSRSVGEQISLLFAFWRSNFTRKILHDSPIRGEPVRRIILSDDREHLRSDNHLQRHPIRL